MCQLNFFVKDQRMPQELTIKLRSYFRNTMVPPLGLEPWPCMPWSLARCLC